MPFLFWILSAWTLFGQQNLTHATITAKPQTRIVNSMQEDSNTWVLEIESYAPPNYAGDAQKRTQSAAFSLAQDFLYQKGFSVLPLIQKANDSLKEMTVEELPMQGGRYGAKYRLSYHCDPSKTDLPEQKTQIIQRNWIVVMHFNRIAERLRCVSFFEQHLFQLQPHFLSRDRMICHLKAGQRTPELLQEELKEKGFQSSFSENRWEICPL